MKVISYSLFSPDGRAISEKYLIGLKANWIAKQQYYPEWEMLIYHDRFLPETHLDFMREAGIGHALRQPTRGNREGYFWRFSPISDPRYSAILVRDIDSRLNVREKSAVDEWMDSQALFHVMRDHRAHKKPMMGGMWGCKRNDLIDFATLFDGWHEFDRYGCDENFLKHCIWPTAKSHVMAHDSHPEWAQQHAREGLRPFPMHPEFQGFVGKIITS